MKKWVVLIALMLIMVSTSMAFANENYNKGLDFFNQRNYQKALEEFKLAYTEMGEHHYLRYMMGLTNYKIGDYKTAVTYYEEAKDISPNHYKTLLNLSRAYLNLQEWAKCKENLETALTIKDNDDSLYNVWGLLNLNQQKYEDAITQFKRARDLNHKNYFALNNLGLSYLKLGMFLEASVELEKAAVLEPPYPYIYNNLGIAYENIGELDKAIEAFNQALDIEPNYSKAVTNLNRALQKRYNSQNE